MNITRSVFSVMLAAGLIILAASTCARSGTIATTDDTIKSLRTKGKQAFMFNRSKGYSTDFCILVDLSRHSGLKRFYIWDFKQDTIALSALVSHGCGIMPWSAT